MGPLIYTIHGHLPIADLKHEVEWTVTPEQVVFIEKYFLGEELVKQNAHVKILSGTSADGASTI
jgi:hypothetical protein